MGEIKGKKDSVQLYQWHHMQKNEKNRILHSYRIFRKKGYLEWQVVHKATKANPEGRQGGRMEKGTAGSKMNSLCTERGENLVFLVSIFLFSKGLLLCY